MDSSRPRSPEAKELLTGLEALGADVLYDPGLDQKIKEALKMRFVDTSWMDPNRQ
jgi:hypothetical protein